MAHVTQTEMQKMKRELDRLSRRGNGTATIVSEGAPTVRGSETDGDTYFDVQSHDLYIFNRDAWDISGNFTWIYYATEVNNRNANGIVPNASDVIGFTTTIDAGVRWIGEVFNQPVPTRSTDPTVYTWRLAPSGLLDATFIDLTKKPGAPLTPVAVDELYRTNQASGVKSRVLLSWTNNVPNDVYASATNIVSFKLSSDTSFTPFGEFDTENCVILDLQPGEYDFRIVAATSLGVKSEETLLDNQTIAGVEAPPSTPTGFSLNTPQGQALLNWNLPNANADLDVLSGGSAQIRHTTRVANATWATSQIIIESIAGATNSVIAPLLMGTYLIKFIDSSGNESIDPAILINTFEAPGFNFLINANQEPDFTGTKTNCTVIDNKLVLDDNQTMMTYDFSSVIDLREIQATRVVPTFVLEVRDRNDTVCNITRICDRLIMCTDEVFSDFKFFISTTNDDPSSPTAVFTPYELLITRDVVARGLRFRVIAETITEGVIEVIELGMSVDVPDVIRIGSLVTTANTAGTNELFAEAFYNGIDPLNPILPRLGIQLIEGVVGDEVLVKDKTTSGFTVTVMNGGVAQAGKMIDYQAIGT